VHEARASLVKRLSAVGALETGGVPLEVGRYAQQVLVADAALAARTRRRRRRGRPPAAVTLVRCDRARGWSRQRFAASAAAAVLRPQRAVHAGTGSGRGRYRTVQFCRR